MLHVLASETVLVLESQERIHGPTNDKLRRRGADASHNDNLMVTFFHIQNRIVLLFGSQAVILGTLSYSEKDQVFSFRDLT